MSLLLIFQSDAEGLAGASSLTFTPAAGLLASGVLAAGTTLTFTPAGTSGDFCSPAFQNNAFQFDAFDQCVDPAIVASGSMIFTPSATLQAVGVLAASTTITFTPAAPVQGFGPTLASSLTFTPAATPFGPVAAVGSATLSFTLNGSTAVGDGVLAGDSDITFIPAGLALIEGAMMGSTTLTFNVSGDFIGSAVAPIIGSTTITFTPLIFIPVNPAAHPIIPRMGELFDDETRERRDRHRRKRWKRARNERNKLYRMLDAQYEGRPYVDEDELEEQAVKVANLLNFVADMPVEEIQAIQAMIAEAQQILLAQEIVRAEIEDALRVSREMLRAKDEEDCIIAMMLME